MCRSDDHLAWKHPVFLKACRGLCTTGGSIFVPNLDSPSWTRTDATPLSVITPISASEDAHACMDRLKRALLEDCGLSLPLLIQMGRSPQENRDKEMWTCYTGLDRSGSVNLGQPSVTMNPLPTHSTHAVPPPGVPFILWPKDDDSKEKDIQIVTHGGRVTQPPPLVARPFDGVISHEEALSQIRVETTTTPEGLIHMMTANRATFGCSGHRVPFVLLDNGSALNPLATAIALGYASLDFGPST
ncbi:hypothetical protein AAG906_003554 [Vitis piasezkii]